MSNEPHLYGTAEPYDKQGYATREVDTGDKSAAEPGNEHRLRLGDGNLVVVKEDSGVAFAEATRDIGAASLFAGQIKPVARLERIGTMVRSAAWRRNMTVAAATGVGFVLLGKIVRSVVTYSFAVRTKTQSPAADQRAAPRNSP